MKSTFALTSAEAKRLIARAVAQMEPVKNALQNGKIVMAPGTTNVFIAEEITGEKHTDKWRYCFGLIVEGLPCVSPEDGRLPQFIIDKGKRADIPFREAVAQIAKEDVFIKGANAVDSSRRIGVLVNHPSGGTVGFATPYLLAANTPVIIPVGLEKLVPSVEEAVRFAGPGEIDSAFGLSNWLMEISIPQAVIVTEIEALEMLAGVKVTFMAAGGIGGSEGAVTLGIEGEQEQVEYALDLVRSIRGEPALTGRRQICRDCKVPCLSVQR